MKGENEILLPTAMENSAPRQQEYVEIPSTQQAQQAGSQGNFAGYPVIVITEGLEFNPSHKFRYGLHALTSAFLIMVSFVLVETRGCVAGFAINITRLQTLHACLLLAGLLLYGLSLCSFAQFLTPHRLLFLITIVLMMTVVGLMFWMTYEAAVNPCVKGLSKIPFDFSGGWNKNVFSRGDSIGIVVLLLDSFATIFMMSSVTNFYRRC